MPKTDWPRLTGKLWERSGGACERCGSFLGSPDHAERHHRRLRSGGGKDELANLLLLCMACHTTASPKSVHANVADAKKHGHIVTRYRDPAPVPVLHALHGWVVLDNAGGFTPSMFTEPCPCCGPDCPDYYECHAQPAEEVA